MRRILISLFSALLAGSLLQAQTLPSLLVNADAAALGAGGSAIAADATAFALENNTAAIPFSDKTVFAGVSYGLWQPSSAAKNQIAFSGWWNSGKRFAAGLYAKTFRYPSYTSINENGVTDSYQNGANQSGTKASADLQAYNSLAKVYNALMDKLSGKLPKIMKQSRLAALRDE